MNEHSNLDYTEVKDFLNYKHWFIIEGCDETAVHKIAIYNNVLNYLFHSKFLNLPSLFLKEFEKPSFVYSTNDKFKYLFNEADNSLNLLKLKQNELSLETFDLNSWEKLEERILMDKNSKKIEFCLTELTGFLVVAYENQICYLNSKTLDIECKIDLTIPFEKIELKPIANTDNAILLLNSQNLFYFQFTQKSLKMIQFENCIYYTVVGHFLGLIGKSEVSIYNLIDNKKLFKQDEDAKFINITPDCKYLAIFSELRKVLKLYRIEKEQKLIAEIPVLSIVTCMNANNKFVILGIDDNRIVSYLIVDHENSSHFNRLTEFNNN